MPGEDGAARPRAGGAQLGLGLLGERRGAGAVRDVERLAQELAGLAAAVRAPQQRAQLGQRPRPLERARAPAPGTRCSRAGAPRPRAPPATTPAVRSATPSVRRPPKARASSTSSVGEPSRRLALAEREVGQRGGRAPGQVARADRAGARRRCRRRRGCRPAPRRRGPAPGAAALAPAAAPPRCASAHARRTSNDARAASAASSSPCSTNALTRIAAGQLAVQSAARELGGLEHRAGVALGALQVAEPQQQPARAGRGSMANSAGSPVARLSATPASSATCACSCASAQISATRRLGEPRQVGRLRARRAGRRRARAAPARRRRRPARCVSTATSAATPSTSRGARGVVGRPAQRLQPRGDRRRRRRVEHAGASASASSSSAAGRRRRSSRAAARSSTSTASADPSARAEHVREHERRAEPGAVVAGAARAPRAVRASPFGCPARRLGDAELEQDPRRRSGARRLGERAAQVDGGRLRRAASRGRAGGLDQPLDGPRVAAGSLASRCSATRSSRPVARRAARPRGGGPRSARPAAPPRVDAARTIGCTNASGRPGSRMPAPTSRSAASAASSRVDAGQVGGLVQVALLEHGDGAGEARWRAPAAGRAAAGSCGRACARRGRRPLRGVGRRRDVLVAAGPSSSSRTRKGRPPVARWQAAANGGVRRAPSSHSTSRATAGSESGDGRTTRAERSASSAPSRSRVGSRPRAARRRRGRARAPPAAAAGRPGSAATAASAQWASSTVRRAGRRRPGWRTASRGRAGP